MYYCVGVIILQGVFMKIFKVFFGGLFSLFIRKIFNSSLLAMGVPYNAAFLFEI